MPANARYWWAEWIAARLLSEPAELGLDEASNIGHMASVASEFVLRLYRRFSTLTRPEPPDVKKTLLAALALSLFLAAPARGAGRPGRSKARSRGETLKAHRIQGQAGRRQAGDRRAAGGRTPRDRPRRGGQARQRLFQHLAGDDRRFRADRRRRQALGRQAACAARRPRALRICAAGDDGGGLRRRRRCWCATASSTRRISISSPRRRSNS